MGTMAIADNGRFSGYLSLPPTGHGPGVLVIQEIFGVNSHIRSIADDYASQGYVALAPDLFWRVSPGVELGYTADDIARGRELRQQIPQDHMLADLQAAATALRALPEFSGKLGAVGYCMGGKLAFALAATPVLDAAVSYYGAGTVSLLHLAERIVIPLQCHYGALDRSIPPLEVEQTRDAFAGRADVEIYLYDDADHGFNCDQRQSYNPEAAVLARSRALAFVAKYLRGESV